VVNGEEEKEKKFITTMKRIFTFLLKLGNVLDQLNF